jgi:predicted phage terminase large subunit-like protein
VTVIYDGKNYYIADCVREKVVFTDLIALVRETYERNKPSRIIIEAASNGIAIEQGLRAWTSLPVIAWTPKGSKQWRAEALTPLFESRRVLLPTRAPWLKEFEQEFLAFPGGRHDDQVDATLMAIRAINEIWNRNAVVAQTNAAWANRAQR